MKKTILYLGFALISILLAINITSAGYYPDYYYSPSPRNDYIKTPTFYNAPTIIDKTSSLNEGSFANNRNYQGPIIQRDTRYDEFLKVGKSGRVTRTVTAQTSERYVGAVQIDNTLSQNRNSYNREFNSIPTNPTYYTESSFRTLPKYNYYDYGPNNYGRSYYYAPRYDSGGYYNWRY